MTGFAILAFSGHCETVDSPDYGDTLIKAINYLVEQSRANSGLMASKPGQHSPYPIETTKRSGFICWAIS